MSDSSADRDSAPLSPRAVGLRNACLGALSRRSRHRPPSSPELLKLRDDLGLRDAWAWWSKIETPTEAVRAIRVVTPRGKGRTWASQIVTLLATGAWLVVTATPAWIMTAVFSPNPLL